MLWFDVESKYEATKRQHYSRSAALWFDVESKYEATGTDQPIALACCGLM